MHCSGGRPRPAPSVAVIGLGAFGREHLKAYARAGARLVAVADSDLALARRTAAEFGLSRVFADGTDLLDSVEPDGVSVVTPAATHVELARAAAERGCKVLLEKPVAATAAELASLSAAARTRILPGHVLRFEPVHQRLKSEVEAGRIGPVLGVAAGRDRGADHRRLYPDIHIARMTTIHDIDLVAWLTGSPIRQVAAATRGDPAAVVQAQLTTESGAVCSVRTSWLLPDNSATEDHLVVYGRDGVARLRAGDAGTVLYGESPDRPWAHAPPEEAPGLDAEIAHFLRWLRGAAEPLMDLAAAAHALAVADAVVASAAAGAAPVDVTEAVP